MPKPLLLYVNRALVAPELAYVALLYPFLGLPRFRESTPFDAAPWKHGYDKRLLQLVDDIRTCEYYLVPHDYWHLKARHPELLGQMLAEARAAGKPVLIDASGDVAGRINVPHAQILRANVYRFDMPKNEIKVPMPAEDLFESTNGGTLPLRAKQETPSIGFAGWGRLAGKQRLRSLVKELPVRMRALLQPHYATKEKGVFWRERALRVFTHSNRFVTDFIVRGGYSGNRASMEKSPEELRKDFIDNLLNTDYALAVKGDANESIRLYETLSLGRIPVLIDTECVLPLEHLIDYKEFCVIINWRDLGRAPDILADFHARLSPEEFLAMQRKARYSFETYLRFDAFTKYLVEMLRERFARKTTSV